MTRSDRTLKKMVRKLLTMEQTDFESIMESLNEEQHLSVLRVIEEIKTEESQAPHIYSEEIPFSAFLMPSELSPWLATRLNGNPHAGDEVVDNFSITVGSLNALRECANILPHKSLETLPSPSLFSRLLSLPNRKVEGK
jgi:hypothetical protein